MSISVENIALYLGRRKGLISDYKLVLTLFESDPPNTISPQSLPLARAERSVADIDSENWYVFNFDNPVDLSTGYYSITLHQENNDEYNPVDFNANFCEWIHSEDLEGGKQIWSFSTESGFQWRDDVSNYGYGFGYGYESGLGYGWGYGYGSDEPFDYFQILGIGGDPTGEGAFSSGYGYGFGYENVTYDIDNRVSRTFKIYEKFNDIVFDDDGKYVRVNLPPAEEATETISNRQEFLDATKRGVDVVGNLLTLSDPGGRVYSADCSTFDSSTDSVDWYPSNFFLSNNDINYADIINPPENTNQFRTWLMAAPYYSGIYFSTDGGSAWRNRSTGLKLPDGTYRNFSCVIMNYDSDNDYFYAIAFDDTNSDERGKVFYAILSLDVIDEDGNVTTPNSVEADDVTWIEAGRITDGGTGLKVNSALFVGNELWVGTVDGVYNSTNYGTWTVWGEITTLPSGTNVNQISASYTTPLTYGYGYGYGVGGDYFDVLGASGYLTGYGVDEFELQFTGEYGFGYGYENIWGRQYVEDIYIATDIGPFLYQGGTWSNLSSDKCYCVSVSNDRIYIGTDSGILRSIDGGVTFEGDAPLTDSFYSYGLLSRKTTSILYNERDLSEIYVSQYGGVFISRNDAGNFTYVSEGLNESRVKLILQNPLNNRILYAITETVGFLNSAVTFLIDSSGSMVANDPDDLRLDVVKKVISSIHTNAVATPYFQIVEFGLSESSTRSNLGYKTLRGKSNVVDFPGTNILTATGDRGGFVAADINDGNIVNTLSGIVDEASGKDHGRTPLFDSVDVLARGMNNSGASWTYNSSLYKYIVEDVASEYFKSLHKSVIIITDGYDTVTGKQASDLMTTFGEMRSEVYVVGVGNNVNFENLKQLKSLNSFAHLYIADPTGGLYRDANVYDFDDFEDGTVSYLDVADFILEREKIQTRDGYWQKIVSYDSKRNMLICNVTANTPPETSCEFRIRASLDKDNWTAWTDYQEANQDISINLSGKFFEIEIHIDSQTTTYSPEVSNIKIVTLTPSESFVLYDSQNSGRERVSEITFSSLDDQSLSVVDEDDVNIEFGFLQSSSSNYNLANDIYRGKRSVVGRNGREALTTENGYFYSAENGAWPMDSSVSTDGVNVYDSNGKSVNRDDYYIIPDKGFVIFYDSRKISDDVYESYQLEILYGTQYRVTTKLTNYTTGVDHFNFHDVAWSYYTEEDSVVRRPAIPFVSSQISSDLYYGKISKENHAVARGLSTTYTLQYIEKSEDGFIGFLEVTTGFMVNLKTDPGGDDIWRYYNQNAFLERFNINDPSDFSYVSVYVGNDSQRLPSSKLEVSAIDNGFGEPQIHEKITITIDPILNFTDTLGVIIGDSSQSSAGVSTKGIPTWMRQSNLLFDKAERPYGETETSFVFYGNGTIRPLEPTFKLCGTTGEKIVITAPSKLKPSSIFSFTVMAVDASGLIDREFVGEVTVGFSDSNLGTLNNETLSFELYDEGTKVLSAFSGATAGVSGHISAEMSFNGRTFKSNPIEIDSSVQIKWGDLNVGSLFSDGRQDIEFIANYAKNISQLDFVCVSDDLSLLSSHEDGDIEWRYIVSKCEELSIGGLDIFPGLRHRSSVLYGERIILFDDFDFIPNVLITDSTVNQDNPIEQINTLINDLKGYSFLTFPIRSAIEPTLPGNTDESWLVNRGLDFETYRNILQLVNDSSSFVYDTEPLVEMYSEHGMCEEIKESYISNTANFTGSIGSQYIQHGLFIGKKFGFIASSGGYASRPGYYTGELSSKTETKIPTIQTEDGDMIAPRGLTAVIVNDSNRSSLVDSFKARNTYCTTGAKIHVSFSGTSGTKTGVMGDELRVLEKTAQNKPVDPVILEVSVKADRSTIKEIVVFKAIVDEVPFVAVHRHAGGFESDESFTFEDTDLADTIIYEITGKEVCYYIRVEQRNGHFAWASPIWFNYGRDNVIASSGSAGASEIRRTILSSSTSKSLVGTFSSSSGQTTPLSEFSPTSPQPGSQLDLFYGDSPTETDYTARKTYSNASLIIGDKTPSVHGMRLLANETTETNVLYGTNFLKFLYNDADRSIYALYHTDLSTDPNGSNFTDDSVDPDKVLKYSKDWGPYIEGVANHGFVGRSKLFGFMWQYSNVGDVGDSYIFDVVNVNTDKIMKQNGSNIPIVRDPFMFYEGGGQYGVLYTGYVSNRYPEKDGTINQELGITAPIDSNYDPSEDPLPSEIGDWGRIEDWAGLLETNLWDSVDRHKILYTNTEDQTEERVFNTVGSQPSLTKVCEDVDGDIIYPTCPNYVTDGTNKRIYYLGWFKGTNNKPTLGLFVATIDGFEFDDLANATNRLCFVFSDVGVPASYTPRVSSFRTEDFIWGGYLESTITSTVNPESLTNWPRESGNEYPHPAFSLGFSWLSVIRYDDGIYYAFMNKSQTRNSSGAVSTSEGGGTAVLYSTDGINFYEYDALDVSRIPSVIKPDGNGIYYCHPFKFNSRWYMVYVDAQDISWTVNAMMKFKYSAFSWQAVGNFPPH